jgi:hypothetical protein
MTPFFPRHYLDIDFVFNSTSQYYRQLDLKSPDRLLLNAPSTTGPRTRHYHHHISLPSSSYTHPLFYTQNQQHVGDATTLQSSIDTDTAQKLSALSERYGGAKDAVVRKLLDRVVLVEPALHRNLKKLTA